MLRTIVLNSRHRVSGTPSSYTIPLTDVLDPSFEHYRLRLVQYCPATGTAGTGSLGSYTIRASFGQPFSYSSTRKGPCEEIGIVYSNALQEFIQGGTRGWNTIIRRPNFDSIRVWFSDINDNPFPSIGEHILVLEIEPVRNSEVHHLPKK